jgi:hypothetical protein
MEINGHILRIYNNREIFIDTYDIDKNFENNCRNIVKTLPELKLLPEFLQGKMTLIPITPKVYLSYCLSNKILMFIPQSHPQNYVFFANVDEHLYLWFIKRLLSFECKV